ncbi:MAG: chlorite dismutase family protein [Acidimicrobiales bacterium]
MPSDVRPASGWGVLHLFLKAGPHVEAADVLDAVAKADKGGTQVVAFAVLGHKADLGVMALAPELWALRSLQSDLQAAGLVVADSYVSITEVSEYAAGMPEEMKRTRLYPTLPPEGKTAFCFYPMSKRRQAGANWYELPYDDREALMQGHGKIGRTFAGRVLQLITGSTGLDDWEWGVTLFAAGPDDLKEVVYTMRYDEASARYAEFGPFYTGMVAPIEEVLVATGLR